MKYYVDFVNNITKIEIGEKDDFDWLFSLIITYVL